MTRRLLALVQSDSRRSLGELARIAGSSRSAVHRRLQRLRHTGIIRQDVALLDRRRLGHVQTFIIRLELRQKHRQRFDRFLSLVRDLPEVQQCYITTGRLNCIAVVLLPDADALDALVEEHFAHNPLVRSYRTSLVTRELKVSLVVPVPKPGGDGENPHS